MRRTNTKSYRQMRLIDCFNPFDSYWLLAIV
jgi:hypothetical protein